MSNKLQFEKSPYLLQHANNPVNWYPWSEEAFNKAKLENKPIFLSIGYSTCHWCHVMERESFEDKEVADILNENFISIKVDREERPDIDSIYMGICQKLTGDGGWPLTIFMNHEKRPFFAGTYFPKYDMYGRIGLISLLQQINNLWKIDNKSLLKISDQIIDSLNKPSYIKEISPDIVDREYKYLKYNFDKVHGGFSYAPKFPTPHIIIFLLRYWYVKKDTHIIEMIEKTLDSMYKGGIYDHIGFGFSRYSTDNEWLVPHFEKMLYDNALLAIAYLEYYQVSKKEKYANIAEDIFTFIKREMTDEKGGFYSAQDADSEGVEGKYYIWKPDEIIEVLGKEEGAKFCNYYDITEEGNFEGNSIPNLIGKSVENDKFSESIEKLYNYRNGRIHPFKDDKILTSWNGLMIAALAIGGRILKNEEYIKMAKKAAYFIINNMTTKSGDLYASYRDGESKILGFAEDYSFFIWGLIEIYESTHEEEFLEKASFLNNKFIENFWDYKDGGFFLYGKNSEELITRPKEIYDGAIPSGNSVAIYNLIRLSKLIEDSSLEEKANSIFKNFSVFIEDNPTACMFGLASMLYRDNTKKVVVVGDNVSEMISKIYSEYNPFVTTLVYTEKIKKMFPNIPEYKVLNNQGTAYICEGFKCNPPTNYI